jgi:hypothetical protein
MLFWILILQIFRPAGAEIVATLCYPSSRHELEAAQFFTKSPGSILRALPSNTDMKIFFAMIALVSMQICARAGVEVEIPSTNQVVLKSGAWTPSPEQPQKALVSIQSFFNHPDTTNGWKNTEMNRIRANMKNYRVQFVGVVRHGKKVIWCNFFPAVNSGGKDEFQDWRRNEVSVDDGGFWFWQIYYDPNTDKCSEFASNGYA